MKINRIILENFKCFENEEFELSSPYTLIIGDNGKGKTAILDAIAAGISPLLSEVKESGSLRLLGKKESGSLRLLGKDDVRLVKSIVGELPTVNPRYPASVTCEGIFQTKEFTWTQSLVRSNVPVNIDKTIEDLSKNLKEIASNGQNGLLPLIVYYGTDRLWIPNQNQDENNSVQESRAKGYENYFHPGSNIIWLIDWLKEEKVAAVKSGKQSDALEVVTSAIADCMQDEDWQTITYDSVKSEVLAEAKDGRLLPLRLLSDGVRNMLAMVADMAYRAAILNPHLGQNAAKETPGIVLIDEIDLHLHPSWQRGVVEALHRTFPKIQFIATTHSPFIIQSLRLGDLINLDSQEAVEYYNESVEDIAEDVMGIDIPQKSKRYQEMMKTAEEYYQLLDDVKDSSYEQLKELEYRLDELEMRYGDDPAHEAFLKLKRMTARLDREVAK